MAASASTTVYVSNLQPSWTATNGGGVYSAYIPPPYTPATYVSPGNTAVYDGREAGIIKAGLTIDPDGHYWDEGLFGFQPAVTINVLAAGVLTYDVQTQYGENPVWMTIEIDTGEEGNRNDNTVYQHVPTTNPAGWHTVDAAAGLWQKWNNNQGDVSGNPLISLGTVAAAHTGLDVVRAYLRLGMGDSYHGIAGNGTVAWVDTATIGPMMYDFVVANTSSNVTGTLVTLTSIAVTPASPPTLHVVTADTQQFTATGTYSDLSTLNITSLVTWDSSIPAVASIIAGPSASGGLATGLASGTTNITASLSGKTSPAVALTVEGSPNSLTLNVPPNLPLGNFSPAAWSKSHWGASSLSGTVTMTTGTNGSSTAWTVNATGAAYMTSTVPAPTQLTDPLLISPGDGPWSCADGTSPGNVQGIPYSGKYTVSGSASASFDLWAAQYIEPGDVAGNYGDMLTFTVGFTP
jgi:hypothetical protein